MRLVIALEEHTVLVGGEKTHFLERISLRQGQLSIVW